MNPPLTRLAFRLSFPLLSLIGTWVMGEPVPQTADAADLKVIAIAEAAVRIAPQFAGEIEQTRAEMQEGAAELRRAAAHMRWLVTLPAARSRRCSGADCAG